MVPAALMAVAFAVFAWGRRYYGPDEVKRAEEKTPAQRQAERDTLVKIAPILALIAVFWFVYDQSASTWIYFSRDHCTQLRAAELPGDGEAIVREEAALARDITDTEKVAAHAKALDDALGKLEADAEKLTVWEGFGVTPDQVQGLNPILIVGLTPFFNWLWNAWRRRRGGVELPDTRKMLLGFGIVIGCMAMITLAAVLAGEGGRVSVWWLLVATFVITLSELCISVVGLEFAYRVAAPGTRSVVTAAFWLTVFVGDLAAGWLDDHYWKRLGPAGFFSVQTAVIVAAAIAFLFVARKFERESNGPPAEAHAA
jgi:POT family proton-dependent oligopeptide transporter